MSEYDEVDKMPSEMDTLEENRKEYWISRRKYFLGDADKANIEKLDMIIAEIKSIKKSIGGI